MTPEQHLEAIHDILINEKRWIKNFNALTQDGKSVDPKDPQAYCFCLIGAGERCWSGEGKEYMSKSASYLKAAIREMFPARLGNANQQVFTARDLFNDHKDTTFWDVKAVLSAALVTARKEAKHHG